jgi:hypothetical protein
MFFWAGVVEFAFDFAAATQFGAPLVTRRPPLGISPPLPRRRARCPKSRRTLVSGESKIVICYVPPFLRRTF